MKRKPDGFTLLEIVLVIMLMVIMLAATVPMISMFVPDVGLESEAKRIKAAIIYTQQQAVLTGLNHKIVFESIAQRYGIQKNNNSSWALIDSRESLQHGVIYKAINLTNDQIEFNPMGEPVPQGGAIMLKGTNGALATISVANISGRVTISTGAGG